MRRYDVVLKSNTHFGRCIHLIMMMDTINVSDEFNSLDKFNWFYRGFIHRITVAFN